MNKSIKAIKQLSGMLAYRVYENNITKNKPDHKNKKKKKIKKGKQTTAERVLKNVMQEDKKGCKKNNSIRSPAINSCQIHFFGNS